MNNNERKTLIVIILTVLTMFTEITFGYLSHSMALLADGWHMGTHAFALSITFFAYILIRKFSVSDKLALGSGKFNPLAGFASAVILAISGLMILYQSAERFFNPLTINFNEAVLIAVIGLIVNGACIVIMGGHGHKHNHKHEHTKHRDYNFKSAYLHILADMLTSVLAIAALLLGKYAKLNFLDSAVGILGGFMICYWAFGLIKNTAKILTDWEVQPLKTDLLKILQTEKIQTQYLHILDNGNGGHIALLKCKAKQTPQEIKNLLAQHARFEFINIEIE